jgi:molybdopterin converting factor small subunit
MVKAELSYNPYLLETVVKFNGREPKINSLVEKYRAGKLQAWIAKLPDIFYNEMNGYDFDLDFSGTKTDFDYLQASFDSAGVSRESVRLFHRNELKGAGRKSSEISALLDWLENNPNRKFNFAGFREANARLFEDDYSYVVVQGTNFDNTFDNVTVENVSDVSELEQATLENMPILFYIDGQNRREFQKNLTELLKRADVKPEQLFFRIDPDLNRTQVERVIKDLGVNSPQTVESPTDDLIKRYLEVYPMTAYVQQVIRVLQAALPTIGEALRAENEQSVNINGAIHQEIDRLDEIIQKLKNVNERIVHRDNFESPDGLSAAKDAFILKILNWRKNKIKINSDKEAYGVATEFENDIQGFFADFASQAHTEFRSAIEDINSRFNAAYLSANFGDGYEAKQEFPIDLSGFALPKLTFGFLELKNEKYVEQTDTPLDIFKNILGSAPANETKGPVRVVTYLYQDWRENAAALASPVADEVIAKVRATLKESYEKVAQDYLEHTQALVERQTQIKDGVSAQLSDDERKLQADNDWFAAFGEKLREIERG